MKTKIILAIILSLFVFNYKCLAQKVVQVYLPNPCSVTSIQKIPQNNQLLFQIYPNPNNGKFDISLKNPESEILKVNIQILDLMGRVVSENVQTLKKGICEFNDFNLTPGIYYIRMQNEKQSAVKMFIVQ